MSAAGTDSPVAARNACACRRARLAAASTPEDAAEALAAAAAAADARDNVTVAVADVLLVEGAAGAHGVRLDGAAARDELGDVGDLAG